MPVKRFFTDRFLKYTRQDIRLPNSRHVECVDLLRNKYRKADEIVTVGIDAEEYYAIKESKTEYGDVKLLRSH